MADMLVKLYALPDTAPYLAKLGAQSILIRRGLPVEKRTVTEWVRQQFSDSWAAACEWSLTRDPVSCFIAVEIDKSFVPSQNPYILPQEKLIGFACYDTSSKGMFGPTGVQATCRGRGIGHALLLTALHAMASERYAYAVIGWVGPTKFYEQTVGATLIEGSEPGIYRGELVSG
ncbi:MAG: GNAT family N-acetyltransferase [Chloroflexi bacterium]|nr:GNAT family N-acetyltransferase [Chloroflexota bacterium]